MAPRGPARTKVPRWIPLASVASVAAVACLPAASEDVGATASAVIDGKPAAVCEWPSVATLQPSGCSAALIHRRAVATAAHCLFDTADRLQSASSVRFGENREAPALELEVGTCYLTDRQEGDFAVCVLKQDAPAIPVISVMTLCESEQLVPGGTAVEVGFGDTSAVGDPKGGAKSSLEVFLVATRSDQPYLEVSSGNQSGEYYGDSGSPLFFKMPDGTWRLVGTDSGSPDIVPGSAQPRFSIYANAAYFLNWAEQNTGLDLSPCHDQAGWHPGADCVSFPSAAPPVADSWSNDCRAQPSASPQPTCESAVSHRARAPKLVPAGGGCSQSPAPRPPWNVAAMLVLLVFGRISRRSRLRPVVAVPPAVGLRANRRLVMAPGPRLNRQVSAVVTLRLAGQRPRVAQRRRNALPGPRRARVSDLSDAG